MILFPKESGRALHYNGGPFFEGQKYVITRLLFFLAAIWGVSYAIDKCIPAPTIFEEFARNRLNPTEIIEYTLSTGLTVVALVATTLVVVWQLTLQKYSGTFLKVLVNRPAILRPWVMIGLGILSQIALWVITYSKGEGKHPLALDWFFSLSLSVLLLAGGIVWALFSIVQGLADLSPRSLLERLKEEVSCSWGRFNSLALSQVDGDPSVADRIRKEVGWVETVIPNITKIGIGALKDGDFELQRKAVQTLVKVYVAAADVKTLQLEKLSELVYKLRLHEEEDFHELERPYWPLGFVLHEIRELHVQTLSYMDPGFSELQHLKFESEWRGLATPTAYSHAKDWVKFAYEIYVAADRNGRLVTSYEVVALATRLYHHLWVEVNDNKDIFGSQQLLDEYMVVMRDLIESLFLMLRYSVWRNTSQNVRLVLDNIVAILELNRSPSAEIKEQIEQTSDFYIYPGMINQCVVAMNEKQYASAAEMIRRLVFFLDVRIVLKRIKDPILPSSPLKGGSTLPPLTGGYFPYHYQLKKTFILLVAYADYQTSRGAVNTSFKIKRSTFPKWLFKPMSQFEILNKDLLGRADIWNDLFLGEAKEQFERIFSLARLHLRQHE